MRVRPALNRRLPPLHNLLRADRQVRNPPDSLELELLVERNQRRSLPLVLNPQTRRPPRRQLRRPKVPQKTESSSTVPVKSSACQ